MVTGHPKALTGLGGARWLPLVGAAQVLSACGGAPSPDVTTS